MAGVGQRCGPSKCGRRASTRTRSSRTFPRSTAARVQRDVKKAQRKDTRGRRQADPAHRRARAVRGRPAVGRPYRQHRGSMETSARDRQLPERRSVTTSEHLFDRFALADVARKVVGVGSVGTRCWICLFEGPDLPKGDRLILQVKEARRPCSSRTSRLPRSITTACASLPVNGSPRPRATSFSDGRRRRRAAASTTCASSGISRARLDPMKMDVNNLSYYGALCAMALARAHARTGDPVEIAGLPRRVRHLRPGDRGVVGPVRRHQRARPRRLARRHRFRSHRSRRR